MRSNIISIDSVGRTVLPKRLREQFNLHAGSELEVIVDSEQITLKPIMPHQALRCDDGLWIHEGMVHQPLADVVREQRESRIRDQLKSYIVKKEAS